MSEVFVISDTHFYHTNMLTFTKDDGTLLRPFNSVNDMNMLIVENWNMIVRPNDKVYHLGDVSFTRDGLKLLGLLNGKKRLVRGNHDGFKLNAYLQYFDEVYGVRQLDGFWMTHIPMHPDSLNHRAKMNIHGHVHANSLKDKRYFNVSVENVDYTPVPFDEIKKLYETIS